MCEVKKNTVVSLLTLQHRTQRLAYWVTWSVCFYETENVARGPMCNVSSCRALLAWLGQDADEMILKVPVFHMVL